MMRRFTLLALSLLSPLALSQVISHTGEEIELSYQASFLLGEDDDASDLASLAQTHSDYLLGVLKSENLVESFGVSFESSEGIGSPSLPLKITGVKSRELSNGSTEISYKYRAKALFHKKAAQKLIAKGVFEVVMPYDLSKIYIKKCTDAHYTSFGDYWYFWDPYREGCEKLLEEPATREVAIQVKELSYKRIQKNTRFDLIRGDNDNGDLLQIDIITGFDESNSKKDIGWTLFANLNKALEENFEFELVKKSGSALSPLYLFEKELNSGVKVLVRHLLVNSALESRGKAFAKFFRESVHKADVVIYSGHSGLGANLDIPSLQEKAGKFVFNDKKRQLFFFNSCSSYSYSLDEFRDEKSKARIDILTNALAAYMDEGSSDVQTLLKNILDEGTSPDWIDVITEMEEANPYDMTYLLSVGGV